VEALDPFLDLHMRPPSKLADPFTHSARSVKAMLRSIEAADSPDLEERLLSTLNSMQRLTT
jgi:hypothetical protein